MSSIKDHYDNHLGEVYSWMMGDFHSASNKQEDTFRQHGIYDGKNSTAIDLGSGHGIQSSALQKLGFEVVAMDFNASLNKELEANTGKGGITIIEDDIVNVKNYDYHPFVITCCGDTLAHLESFEALQKLINDCYDILLQEGMFYVTFRDYSNELRDIDRFIPVQQDENKIVTCFLEYFPDYVRVTDLLHEKSEGSWQQRVSSYNKLRISFQQVERLFVSAGFKITFSETGRMNTIIGEKK